MEKAIIFENDLIRIVEARSVVQTHQYVIYNKTNHMICIHCDGVGKYEPFIIPYLKPTVLYKNEEIKELIDCIRKGNFHIENLSETERVFNDLLDEIEKQTSRLYNQYSVYEKSESENVYNTNRLVTICEILKAIK